MFRDLVDALYMRCAYTGRYRACSVIAYRNGGVHVRVRASTLRRCYAPGMPVDPTSAHDRWPDVALDERFRSLDKDVVDLELQVRAIAPLVGDVHGLNEATASLRRDIGKLEDTVKVYVNRSVTKQLVIVSTPMFFGSVGLLIALFSGRIG